MTRRNALLLGVAGIIFTILLSSVEIPETLRRPILIQIQDKNNVYYDFQDLAYSQKELFEDIDQPYLFSTSQNNEGDPSPSPQEKNNFNNPSFEYRSLKNSRSFLFNLDKNYALSTKYSVDSEFTEPDTKESESNSLIWAEVGDDPASLEDAYPKGVVQFYIRLLNPLFTSDQRQPKGWSRMPRHFLPGSLYDVFEDYIGSSLVGIFSTSEKEFVGSILAIVYESHSPEHLVPFTWIRVYYLNSLFYKEIVNDVSFLYQDIKLPGMGVIESLSLSNGTVTFSRKGDHSLFWTGDLPKPICSNTKSLSSCSLKRKSSLNNIIKGPPASRYYSSRSVFKSGGLSSIKFNRLESINSPESFSILMSSFKLSENKYIAEIRSWYFDNLSLSSENKISSTTNSLDDLKEKNESTEFVFKDHIDPDWNEKKLSKMEIPIYYDVYGNMIESITQNTLLGSLTDHLMGHDHIPSPSFINLSGESLVIFPYRNVATLIKYCSIPKNPESPEPELFYLVKRLSFETEIQESIETRENIYITQNRYARSNLDFVATRSYPIIQNFRQNLNNNNIFQRLSSSKDNKLVSLQFGDKFILIFRNDLPSDRISEVCSKEKTYTFTLKPQFIIQSQDIDSLNVIGSLLYTYYGKDYLILVHSHGEVSSWILHEEESKVSFSHIPMDRKVMMAFTIIVISLFVSNELRIPHQ